MRSASRIVLVLFTVLIVAGLVAPSQVSAHIRPTPSLVESLGPAAPTVVPEATRAVSVVASASRPGPLAPLALAVALVGLGLAIMAPRRAMRIALVVVIAVFVVETGVHSVHHLADRHAGDHCAVSLASAHVQGASIDAPAVVPWMPIPIGTVALANAVAPGIRPLRPDEGRAPPA